MLYLIVTTVKTYPFYETNNPSAYLPQVFKSQTLKVFGVTTLKQQNILVSMNRKVTQLYMGFRFRYPLGNLENILCDLRRGLLQSNSQKQKQKAEMVVPRD